MNAHLTVRRAGLSALLVELPDPTAVHALHQVLVSLREAGTLVAPGEPQPADIVPGARTVLIDGLGPSTCEQLAQSIPTWALAGPGAAGGLPGAGPLAAGSLIQEPVVQPPEIQLPVVFDGADLAEVATHWGVPVEEIPALMCGTELKVAFCGFAPGFAYLSGLGRHTPRRTTPRTAVPAGAVGVAGDFAGVYPRSSPGGWQIVGTVAFADPAATLWDSTRSAPALLSPGTRVRFVEVPP